MEIIKNFNGKRNFELTYGVKFQSGRQGSKGLNKVILTEMINAFDAKVSWEKYLINIVFNEPLTLIITQCKELSNDEVAIHL